MAFVASAVGFSMVGVLCWGLWQEGVARSWTEDEFHHAEALLAVHQEVSHLGAYEINMTVPYKVRCSSELFRILGAEQGAKETLSEDSLSPYVHPVDRVRVRETIEEGIRNAHGWRFDHRVVRPDGEVRHVQNASLLLNGRIVGMLHDVTERRQLEQEVLHISEQEQRRIGQDLHDGICQQLTGIEIMSEAMEQSLELASNPQAASAGQIAKHLRAAISQTRMLAHGLCPVVLESEGLMSALQELAHSTTQMFGVMCVFRCEEPVPIYEHPTATHLYRIAQEAVANALKHGKATHIEINITAAGDRVCLAVQDNGCGLPVAPQQRGAGLRIMQYRAGMFGGSVTVQDGEAGGVTVSCTLHQSAPPAKQEVIR